MSQNKIHNTNVACGRRLGNHIKLRTTTDSKQVTCGHCIRLYANKNTPAQVVEKKLVKDTKSERNAANRFCRSSNGKKLVNHVALVIDSSGSMQGLSQEVVKQVNAQIEEIKRTSQESGQETYLSLYTFAYTPKKQFSEIPVAQVGRFSNYSPGGQTALYDAVLAAINDLDAVKVASNVNSSNLIIVLTDGYENQSGCTKETFRSIIQAKNQTDRWSFVFQGPSGCTQILVNAGVLPGNITEWAPNKVELERASYQTQSGYKAYSTLRSTGVASTQSFYSPNLSSVTGAKLARKLQDVSKDFLRLNINSGCRIDTFVKETTGQEYVKGSGYYQLTKKEKAVQAYKELIVQDVRTNELYRGSRECRELLGLPLGGTIELHPASHKDYKVFVNSTSFNRKLVSGTVLLLDKGLI